MDADTWPAQRRRLVRYLARGGHIVREDVGGAIGIRCCGAARSGREFDVQVFERLLETGATFKRQAYRLERVDGRTETFRFQPQENADG